MINTSTAAENAGSDFSSGWFLEYNTLAPHKSLYSDLVDCLANLTGSTGVP